MQEQVPPQGGEQQGGPEELIAAIQGQIDGLMQGAEALAQTGAKGPSEKLGQAAQLIQAAVEELTSGPQQGGQAQNADVAGTNAQPVTIAGR